MCSLYVTYESHMTWFGQIETEPQSRRGQNLKQPVWPRPLTFHPEMWCDTSPPHVLYVCHICTDLAKWRGSHGTDTKKLQKTCVTLNFDLLTWKLIKTHCHVRDYICAKYKADRSNRHGAMQGHDNFFLMKPVTLTFHLWIWNLTHYKHFIL